MRDELERKRYRCFEWTDLPGTEYPPHTHPHDEVLCVLSGTMHMTVAGEERTLHAGDHLELPRNTVHTATVVGNSPVRYLIGQLLLLLLLCLPAHAWPEGWKVTRDLEVDPKQVKLPVAITKLNNTFLDVHGHALQVNTIVCGSEQDAKTLAVKLGNPFRIFQQGTTVTELVSPDNYLLTEAVYALGYKPLKQSYRVTFRAAGLQDCAPMAWNRMFNACRTNNYDEVQKLRPQFKFANTIRPRNPKAEVEQTEPRFGFPEFSVITKQDVVAFAPTPGPPGKVDATPFWPSNDPELKQLSDKIVQGQPDKVRALLAYGQKTMTYGGTTGSRWGVKKFLAQKTGQCWDYSDLFITLARAQGIPARQVMGWMVGQGGHVWAEVYTDQGWLAVDPTAGAPCGSDVVPLFTSEDGKVPALYTSSVNVTSMAERQ